MEYIYIYIYIHYFRRRSYNKISKPYHCKQQRKKALEASIQDIYFDFEKKSKNPYLKKGQLFLGGGKKP